MTENPFSAAMIRDGLILRCCMSPLRRIQRGAFPAGDIPNGSKTKSRRLPRSVAPPERDFRLRYTPRSWRIASLPRRFRVAVASQSRQPNVGDLGS